MSLKSDDKRSAAQAEAERLGQQIITLEAKIAATDLDENVRSLTEQLGQARRAAASVEKELVRVAGVDVATGLNLKQIDDAIAVLARNTTLGADKFRELTDAFNTAEARTRGGSMRMLVSAAETVAKPLEDAKRSLLSFGPAVQAGLMPAMKAAQAAADSLARSILKTETVSGQASAATLARYERALEVVGRLKSAIENMARVEAAAGRVGGGVDARTQGVLEDINRSQKISESASGLSAASLSRSPQITGDVNRVAATTQQVAELFSRLQNRLAKNLPTDRMEGQLERLLVRLRKYQTEAEKRIRIELDAEDAQRDILDLQRYVKNVRDAANFKIVGDFENIAQVKAALDDAVRSLDKFDDRKGGVGVSRADMLPPLEKMNVAADAGDFKAFKVAYEDFKRKAAEGLEINLKADTAQERIDAVAASLDALRKKIASTVEGGFTIPVELGGEEEAKSAVDQLLAKLSSIVDRSKESMPAGAQSAMADSFVSATQAIEEFSRKAQSETGATIADFLALISTINSLETSVERLATLGDGLKKISAAADVFAEARRRGPTDPTAALSEVVSKGEELTRKALALPATFIQENAKKLSSAFAQYSNLSKEALEAAKRREDQSQSPQSRGGATKVVANRVAAMAEALETIQAIIQVQVDKDEAEARVKELDAAFAKLREEARFSLTGLPGVDQIEGSVREVLGLVAKLRSMPGAGPGVNAFYRGDVSDLLASGERAKTGDPQALADFQQKYEALKKTVESGIEVLIKDKEAQDTLKRLDEYVLKLREDLKFQITGDLQNADQVKQEIASLMSEVDRLENMGDAGVRANMLPRVTAIRQRIESAVPVFQAAIQPGATDAQRQAADAERKSIKLDVDSARQFGDDLMKSDDEAKKVVANLKEISNLVGAPAPMEALRKAAQRASTEVEKVKDATKRAALEARLLAAQPQIAAAQSTAEQQRLAGELTAIGDDAKVVVEADLKDEKLRKKIDDLNAAWKRAITGTPQGIDEADRAMASLLEKVGKLSTGDRARFAPLLANLIAVRAVVGDNVTAIQKLAEDIKALDTEAGNTSKVDALLKKLDALSKNTTTNALRTELEAAKTAGTEPSEALTRRVETIAATGRDPNDPLRQTEVMRNRLTAVKSQLESLDEPVRAGLTPAIEKATVELDFLANMGMKATKGDVQRVAAALLDVETKANRAKLAMDFRMKFDASGLQKMLDSKTVRGYEAQLEILASVLTRLTGKAGNEGRAAFLKFSEAVARAFNDNTIGDPAVRKNLEKIGKEAAKTIGSLQGSGTSASRLGAQMKRAGDVGRGGFDNFSLAVNQAAFAIDDFMSSTGGIEFKLRAISNNITQMAFVMGGTKGLFIGLGAVIGGQIAIGLMKFANGGQAAEDRTKALNDALSKQKTTVDELARAYGELGKQLLRGTLSSGADSAMEMASSMKAAADAMRQLSREGIGTFAAASGERPGAFFSNSLFAPKNIGNEQRGVTGVLAERAQQESLRKRIEGSENPGEIAVLRQQIEESRKRERAAAGRATAQLTPDVFTIQSATKAASENLRFRGSGGGGFVGRNSFGLSQLLTPEGLGASLGSVFGLTRSRSQQAFDAARDVEDAYRSQGAMGGASTLARERQVASLQNAIKALTPLTQQKNFFVFASGMAVEAQKATAEFQQLIELIRRDLRTGLTSAIESTTNSLQDAANEISSAQEQVAEAIRRGVPSARELQRELNSLGAELAGAYQSLAEASDMAAAGENPEGKTPKSEQGRLDAVARAQTKVDEVRARRAELETRVVRAMVAAPSGAERASAALSRIQGTAGVDVEATGTAAALQGAIARETLARSGATDAANRLAALEKQLAEQDAKVAAEENGIARLRLQAERDDIDSKVRAARAAADAATASEREASTKSTATAAFAEFVASVHEAASRIRAIGDSALQAATRTADTLRQAAAENPTRGELRGFSDSAERMLIDDSARVRVAQDNLATEAARIARFDPSLLAIQARREELLSHQRQAAERMAAEDIPEPPEDAQFRRQALIELDRQQEQLTFDLLEARRRELQQIEAGAVARQREIEKSLARDREQPSIDRQQKQIDSAMNTAEQRLAEQQQRFIQAPTAENERRRDAAVVSLGASRRKAQELQDNLDRKRAQLEGSDPVVIAERQKLAQIVADKAKEAQAAAEQGRPVDERRMAALDEQERGRRAAIDARMAGQTLDERKAIDKFAQQQDILARNEAGRRLGLTERARFREDMEVGIGADIRARAAVLNKQGVNPDDFINRALSEQMKTVAPMLEEFRMERETAMLQGPSRAALQISDVTTSQGQSELNRLLRGDDAAKDVNLAELQKQSGLFQELINVVRNNPLPVLP